MTEYDIKIPTIPGFYSAFTMKVEDGFRPYELLPSGEVRVDYESGPHQMIENMEAIELLGPFKRLTGIPS